MNHPLSFIHSCPCCSGYAYESCCKPIHQGKFPKNALELMRARYAAYVLNLPEFLIETTHPGNPEFIDHHVKWKESLSDFSEGSTFHKLRVLDFKEKESVALVTFTAYLSHGSEDATFTERSYFERIDQRWLYRDCEVSPGIDISLIPQNPIHLLPLTYYGDPLLRKKASPVSEINSSILELIDAMIETMDLHSGMGLAAPQIGHSLRLFVIRMPRKNAKGQVELGEVKVFINPELSTPSRETWKVSEGCLSIPGIRAEVERPTDICIEYTNREGCRIKEMAKDWEARVIQHEFDHIEGILFLDRTEEKTIPRLKSLIKKLEKRFKEARK